MTDRKTEISPFSILENVTIRRLEKPDLPALEWDGEYTHFRNIFLSLYKRMLNGTAMAWIAELQGTGMIGQIFLQLNCDRPELADGWNRAYMYSFRIKPPYRGLGIGSKMLDIVEEYLLANKFTRMTLNVARDNTDAIRLYRRCGFEIVAEEPGVWSYIDHLGTWHTVHEPSWRMEKLLRLHQL